MISSVAPITPPSTSGRPGISVEVDQDPRAGESRQKRAHLLHVARRQFILKGYRDTKMDDIAVAAGVSKRTLYLWHDDKAALFRACVIQGARLFPMPASGDGEDLPATLRRFALELASRLAEPEHSGMGRLLIRDRERFPELMAEARRSHEVYLIEPLAAWLRARGLEREDGLERTRIFVAMALAPVHDELLLGTPPLDADALERHAELTVALFLGSHRAGGGDRQADARTDRTG